jgi:predicted neutral ceramidase superfamily lipid hydrolase
MSSDRENLQAQNFIYEIFRIVAESLKSAMPNKQKINDLLGNAGLVIEQNQSVKSLFEQLASEIKDDPVTVAMIHNKREHYKLLISQALESTQIIIRDEDWPDEN